MIRFSCPRCQSILEGSDQKAGSTIVCPKCGQSLQVPPAARSTAKAATAPKPAPTTGRDQPSQRHVHPLLTVAKWFILSLAMVLALSAATLPLVGVESEPLNYGVAGGAILVGLAAVLLSIMARKSLLEGAVTTVFLAVTGLLVSMNIVMASSRTRTAADAMARAVAKEDEVQQIREQGEAAQKSAAEILKKAEAAEAKAEEAPEKAARLLEEVKAEQVKLDKKSKHLDEQTEAVAAERAKVAEAKAKLDDQAHAIEDEKKAAAKLVKSAEEEKQAAATLVKKAEDEKRLAKESQDKAEQKEKDAQELNKKVMEAIDGVKGKLRGKAPTDRRDAIVALAQLGEMAAKADYDLCEVIVSDPVPELRLAALAALEKVQPKLHPLVVTLALPPENSSSAGYLRAIRELPTFGRAGLPLIVNHLQGQNPNH